MVKMSRDIKSLWRGVLKIHDFKLTLPTRISTKDRGRYYSSLLVFQDKTTTFRIFDKRLSTAQKIMKADRQAVIGGLVSADLRKREEDTYLVMFPLDENEEPDAHLLLVSVYKQWKVQPKDPIFITMIESKYKKLYIIIQPSEAYKILT